MSKHHPAPVGAYLNEKQVEEVAKTIFNRYHYEYGMTAQFNDDSNSQMRNLMKRRIKEMLDAMDILGYTITPKKSRDDVGREFLTKSTVK